MDIYTIIFAALAVVVCLGLYRVLGQRTGSERPYRLSAFYYRLSMIAAVLGAVNYVAYEAKWYAALAAARNPYHNHQRGPPASSSWAYYWRWHSSWGLRWSCLSCIGRIGRLVQLIWLRLAEQGIP